MFSGQPSSLLLSGDIPGSVAPHAAQTTVGHLPHIGYCGGMEVAVEFGIHGEVVLAGGGQAADQQAVHQPPMTGRSA